MKRSLRWMGPFALVGAGVGMSAVFGGVGLGCGAGAKDAVTATAASDLTDAQIDADPMALLPGSAVVAVAVDARAFFQSQAIGAAASRAVETLVSVGDATGFVPSRDVDKVVAATYASQGLDVVAALRGRFDVARLTEAAQNHTITTTTRGGVLVQSSYAGRALFTVNNVGFVVLTPGTALVGTEGGIRRALDRLRDGHVQRALAPWVITTLETAGAELALAADFASQPIATASLGSLPLPWLQGLRTARVIGNFGDPGMNVAGSLSYADAASASQGEAGVRQAGTLLNLFALTGLAPKLRDLDVATVQTDVQYKFAVDDASLRGLFTSLPSLLATLMNHAPASGDGAGGAAGATGASGTTGAGAKP